MSQIIYLLFGDIFLILIHNYSMDYVCAYVRLLTAHICHCTLIQLCSCSHVLHFVYASWVYFYMQMMGAVWRYRARVICFF